MILSERLSICRRLPMSYDRTAEPISFLRHPDGPLPRMVAVAYPRQVSCATPVVTATERISHLNQSTPSCGRARPRQDLNSSATCGVAASTVVGGRRTPLAETAYSILAALGMLLSVGASTAQSDATFAFIESVADRMELQPDDCPQALSEMFNEDATLICHRHFFADFGSFQSEWDSAAVWEGRFTQVEPWFRSEVSTGDAHLSLFRLDDDRILVFFAPGMPGPIAFLINDIAAAQARVPASQEARASGPRRVYDTLGIAAASNALAYRGNDFVRLDRRCQPEDVACTAELNGRSALTVMRDLGLADYGWRIQDIGSDTVYSTVDENLVVILAESRRGVTVTAARLDRGLKGAPFIPGP